MAEDLKTAIDALGIQPPEADEPLGTEGVAHCDPHRTRFPAFHIIAGVRVRNQCPECALQAAQQVATKQIRAITDGNAKAAAERKREAFEARIGRACIPKRYRNFRLETFPVEHARGNCNVVVEGCRMYLNGWTRNKNTGTGLIMIGGTGRGKTGLACSIGNAVLEQGDSVLFATAQDVIVMITSTWGNKKARTEAEVTADFTEPDLLILDDVGAQVGTDLEINRMFGILNTRYSDCKPTILLSNLPLDDSATVTGLHTYLGQRIMGRMMDDGAMVLRCQWDSLRGKRA